MEEYKRNIQFNEYIFEIESQFIDQCKLNKQPCFNRSQIIRHLYRQYLEVNTKAIQSTGKTNSDYREGVNFKEV